MVTSDVESLLRDYDELVLHYEQSNRSLEVTQSQMDAVLLEQGLLEQAVLLIKQVKPLLSASSLKQCEDLADSAISAVFQQDWKVHWNPEDRAFLLDKGNGIITDLAEASGGGLCCTVSFVFTVYLLMKLGRRKFMAYDEAFTQISAEFLPRFIDFARTMCKDLGIDLLLISHDARIEDWMVDRVYRIQDGHSIRVK